MNPGSKLKSVFLTSLSIGFLAFALWPAFNTAASRIVSPEAQNPQKPYQGFPDFGQMISSTDYETVDQPMGSARFSTESRNATGQHKRYAGTPAQ